MKRIAWHRNIDDCFLLNGQDDLPTFLYNFRVKLREFIRDTSNMKLLNCYK